MFEPEIEITTFVFSSIVFSAVSLMIITKESLLKKDISSLDSKSPIKLLATLYFFITIVIIANNVYQLLLFLLIIISITAIIKITVNNIGTKARIKRRNKKLFSNSVVIPQYEPPAKIHPAVAGFLIDKKINKKELYATVFNLIINGHLAIDEKIVEGKYKYYLIKNRGFNNNSAYYDRIISEYLFCRKRKQLDIIPFEKVEFDPDIVFDLIKSELTDLKYFEDNFEDKRSYTKDYSEEMERECLENFNENISIFNTPIPYLLKRERFIKKIKNEAEKHNRLTKKYFKIAREHPYRKIKKLKFGYSPDDMFYTEKGIQERAKWLGFKDYLQTAERFRLDEEKIETFSKYLPYAVTLGVETEWARRFEGIEIDRLEWFNSDESEKIRRHKDIHFKHLINFLGEIQVINPDIK